MSRTTSGARPLQRRRELRGQHVPVAEDGVIPQQARVRHPVEEPASVEDREVRLVRRDTLHLRLAGSALAGYGSSSCARNTTPSGPRPRRFNKQHEVPLRPFEVRDPLRRGHGPDVWGTASGNGRSGSESSCSSWRRDRAGCSCIRLRSSFRSVSASSRYVIRLNEMGEPETSAGPPERALRKRTSKARSSFSILSRSRSVGV